jgi:hypothetical protein
MRFSIVTFIFASALTSGVAAAPYTQQQGEQAGGAQGGAAGGQASGTTVGRLVLQELMPIQFVSHFPLLSFALLIMVRQMNSIPAGNPSPIATPTATDLAACLAACQGVP